MWMVLSLWSTSTTRTHLKITFTELDALGVVRWQEPHMHSLHRPIVGRPKTLLLFFERLTRLWTQSWRRWLIKEDLVVEAIVSIDMSTACYSCWYIFCFCFVLLCGGVLTKTLIDLVFHERWEVFWPTDLLSSSKCNGLEAVRSCWLVGDSHVMADIGQPVLVFGAYDSDISLLTFFE